MSFKLVYFDNMRRRYVFKDLGVVTSAHPTAEEQRSLDDARFVIGDFLDVAIFYGPSSERRSSNAAREWNARIDRAPYVASRRERKDQRVSRSRKDRRR
jgi:hypothetical protein